MIRRIFLISRPRFWIYLLGPYIVGSVAGSGNIADFFSINFWYGLFFFLLPANIFLYGVNDFFDTETDYYNAKKGTKEYLMKQADKTFYAAIVIAAFVLSVPLFIYLDTISRYFFVLFFLLSFFYSAPPFRFKARPFLDFSSNILYILPGIIFYVHLAKEPPSLLVVIAGACWTGAMHLYSAIPDIEADKKAHILTTAVLLGSRKSLILCILLWGTTAVIASGISFVLTLAWVYPLLTSSVLGGYISGKKMYWYFPWINLVLGFLLFLYVATI